MKNYEEIARTIIEDADKYDINAPGHHVMLLTGIIGLLAEIASLLQSANEYSDTEEKK